MVLGRGVAAGQLGQEHQRQVVACALVRPRRGLHVLQRGEKVRQGARLQRDRQGQGQGATAGVEHGRAAASVQRRSRHQSHTCHACGREALHSGLHQLPENGNNPLCGEFRFQRSPPRPDSESRLGWFCQRPAQWKDG